MHTLLIIDSVVLFATLAAAFAISLRIRAWRKP